MRIGIITGEYPPMQGGVGAYSQILARALAAQGHKLFVFTHLNADEETAFEVAPDAERWNYFTLRAMNTWARDLRLEVVNLQYQTAAYGMSPFIHFLPDALKDSLLVTTFHDLRYPYLFPKAGALRQWIVRRLARASDGVIVTNHEDAAQLSALPHVKLIPIGSNITVTLPPVLNMAVWRAKASAQASDFLIAFFGFANRSKGLGVLLESLAQLRADTIPARLVMIGGRTGSSDPTNAAYADEIDAQIDALQLKPHVCQTGFVDDEAVAAFMRASDVIALPFLDGASFRRGTLMAAVQQAGAVVTTQPAISIPEFVDGANMLFVPPGDASALASALRRLYDSPDLRARLREGAAALAPRFDWTQIACDTADFFKQIRQ
jgi:glycosyltransferase involved in cell wall biosynthesis